MNTENLYTNKKMHKRDNIIPKIAGSFNVFSYHHRLSEISIA